MHARMASGTGSQAASSVRECGARWGQLLQRGMHWRQCWPQQVRAALLAAGLQQRTSWLSISALNAPGLTVSAAAPILARIACVRLAGEGHSVITQRAGGKRSCTCNACCMAASGVLAPAPSLPDVLGWSRTCESAAS